MDQDAPSCLKTDHKSDQTSDQTSDQASDQASDQSLGLKTDLICRQKSETFLRQLVDLLTYPPLWLIGAGSSCIAFVYLGVALWLPTHRAEVGSTFVNPIANGLVFFSGLAGLFYGARLSDCVEKKAGNGPLNVMLLSSVVSLPLLWFCQSSTSFVFVPQAYLTLLFTLSLSVAPLLTVFANYVPNRLRVQAVALQTIFVCISLFVLGPFHPLKLYGANQIAHTLIVLPAILVFSSLMWTLLLLFYWRPVPWPTESFTFKSDSTDQSRTRGRFRVERNKDPVLFSVDSIPWYQAHRGYRPDSAVIENTIVAFRKAKEAGAEMLECDVHLTRDQQVVVFHDFDLQRLGGGPEKVSELTADELYKRTRAPRLIDLLNDPESPRLLNIELKTGRVRDESGFEARVVDTVRAANAESRVLFSSFNPFALRRLAKLAPSIPRALLVTERSLKLNRFYFKRMLLGIWSRPHLVHLEQSMVTARRLYRWAWRGLPVAVWTVNNPQRARELLHMGVISVISDCALSTEL